MELERLNLLQPFGPPPPQAGEEIVYNSGEVFFPHLWGKWPEGPMGA